jgi:hypothetical protein
MFNSLHESRTKSEIMVEEVRIYEDREHFCQKFRSFLEKRNHPSNSPMADLLAGLRRDNPDMFGEGPPLRKFTIQIVERQRVHCNTAVEQRIINRFSG